MSNFHCFHKWALSSEEKLAILPYHRDHGEPLFSGQFSSEFSSWVRAILAKNQTGNLFLSLHSLRTDFVSCIAQFFHSQVADFVIFNGDYGKWVSFEVLSGFRGCHLGGSRGFSVIPMFLFQSLSLPVGISLERYTDGEFINTDIDQQMWDNGEEPIKIVSITVLSETKIRNSRTSSQSLISSRQYFLDPVHEFSADAVHVEMAADGPFQPFLESRERERFLRWSWRFLHDFWGSAGRYRWRKKKREPPWLRVGHYVDSCHIWAFNGNNCLGTGTSNGNTATLWRKTTADAAATAAAAAAAATRKNDLWMKKQPVSQWGTESSSRTWASSSWARLHSLLSFVWAAGSTGVHLVTRASLCLLLLQLVTFICTSASSLRPSFFWGPSLSAALIFLLLLLLLLLLLPPTTRRDSRHVTNPVKKPGKRKRKEP